MKDQIFCKSNFYNYFYKFSYIKEEDWSYIVNLYIRESRHIDISKKANEIIYKINKSLKLNYICIIINAMIIFHRYYLYNIYTNHQFALDNSKLPLIALVCFFISTKSFDIKIKIDTFLDYSYKCGALEKSINDKEDLLFYEMDILCINGFNISKYKFNFTNSYNIFQNILKSHKIEIKDDSLSQNIKINFLSLIRLASIFPFFLKYNPNTIILGCSNILIKNIFPNREIQIWNNKEYSNIRNDIINFSNLFEKLFLQQRGNTNNINDFNNINNTNNQRLEEEEDEINFENIRKINTNY